MQSIETPAHPANTALAEAAAADGRGATGAPPRGRSARLARAAAAALLLACGVCILTFTMTGKTAANRDFIAYWAAGRQLVQHENPYDRAQIVRLQKSAGAGSSQPYFMRNGPQGFFLALPLGWLPARSGAILWSLAMIGCLFASIHLLRGFYGNPLGDLHLFAYLFPPVLACLLAGQTALFLLLGVAVFLRFHETRPRAAGAALLLLTLKLHLFVPFGLVAAAWAITRKKYSLLVTGASAIAASCAFSFCLDPRAWTQYSTMMRAQHVGDEFIPNLSLVLRLVIDRHVFWLQFVPVAFASVWALLYFRRHRKNWDWGTNGQILLLVSVLAAPYSWFTDEAVLLPAILGGLYSIDRAGRSFVPIAALGGIAFCEVLAGVPLTSGAYVWTPAAWLLWHLSAVRNREEAGSLLPKQSSLEQ